MRSFFRNVGVFGRTLSVGRNRGARPRRLRAGVEDLESRNLMTGGSVVQTGGLVTVTPAPSGPNTAIVSYHSVNGTTMLDVNLNGTDHDFSLSQVGFVYYMGSSSSGAKRSRTRRVYTRSPGAVAGQTSSREAAAWMSSLAALAPIRSTRGPAPTSLSAAPEPTHSMKAPPARA